MYDRRGGHVYFLSYRVRWELSREYTVEILEVLIKDSYLRSSLSIIRKMQKNESLKIENIRNKNYYNSISEKI